MSRLAHIVDAANRDAVSAEAAYRIVSYVMLAFDMERTDAERVIALAMHLRGLRHALGENFFSAALSQAITLERDRAVPLRGEPDHRIDGQTERRRI